MKQRMSPFLETDHACWIAGEACRRRRRRSHPVRALDGRVRGVQQSGHAGRNVARPGGPLLARGRAAGRCRGGRRAQALARLQPGARERPVERPVCRDARHGPAARLWHEPRGRDPDRHEDRARTDRQRHRGRCRHRERRADRRERGPAQDPAAQLTGATPGRASQAVARTTALAFQAQLACRGRGTNRALHGPEHRAHGAHLADHARGSGCIRAGKPSARRRGVRRRLLRRPGGSVPRARGRRQPAPRQHAREARKAPARVSHAGRAAP